MMKLAYIERNVEYAIDSITKWRGEESKEIALSYLASALDELRKAKPVKEYGEVTCSTGDRDCLFLKCRHFGTDTFCAASPDMRSVFYGEDRYLVPCKDCVWKD